MLEKLLIANCNEIAVRIIRAGRKMEIALVTVYSDADTHSLPVRLVDEAVNTGPPPAAKNHVQSDAILDTAQRTGATRYILATVFSPMNAAFARVCNEAGLIFGGPTP